MKSSVSNANDDLRDALYEGDAEKLKSAIASGANVNRKNEYGDTALSLMSYRGLVDCVEVLLKAGADKDSVDNEGRTPLITALLSNKTRCAEMLIEAGANSNLKDINGVTALMIARRKRNYKLVHVLENQKHGKRKMTGKEALEEYIAVREKIENREEHCIQTRNKCCDLFGSCDKCPLHDFGCYREKRVCQLKYARADISTSELVQQKISRDEIVEAVTKFEKAEANEPIMTAISKAKTKLTDIGG